MNQWLSDTNHISNGHAALGPTPDLPMSFPQQPQTINPAQFQNQNFLNGAGRTSSPAFHQPMYQTNQVIPSKRAREDSLGTSPRQSHNAPPGSRSQTPGQPQFSGFNPQANGNPSFTSAPTPFQHLQTSSNATPSPTMQQMGFPPGNPATQRVSTASPSPFSPQHNMTGASPAPSDRGSRVSTPHDMPQNFMASGNPNFNPQQFAQGMGGQMNMAQMMANSQMQQMNPAQRYQMQLQMQAAQLARQQAQARGVNGMQNGLQGHMGMQANPQEQQVMQQPKLNNTPQDFFRALQQFSAAKGRPIDITPQICGRQIEALRLYQAIFKGGGSKQITKLNQWGMVAQHLQFMPQQIPQAAAELQQWWMGNVGAFEQMWIAQQQKQRQALQNQMQAQMSPSRDGQQQNNMNMMNNMNNHQRTQSDAVRLNGQAPHLDAQHMNGYMPKDQNDVLSHKRTSTATSLSRQMDPNDLSDLQTPTQTDPSQKRPASAVKVEPEPEATMPIRKPIEDPFVPEVMSPSRNHGPINIEEAFNIGQAIVESKPVVPTIRELGVIDIHALTMSIKCGMHGEMRNALDTLITLSSEPSLQIQLDLCDELMDALVDCAQVEVDFLAEHASEVTDEVSLSSYEELVRGCHSESRLIQPIPEFGSLEYDLDRAADRLICITTLIRNFSFYEPNFVTLGQPEVVQFVTRLIQQIGTKDMPLRTSRNTLDFMKDIIIYLSNLSSHLHIPSRQDALCLLHFLLAFAPTPLPTASGTDKIVFTSYNPSIHKYLPPAVDSLAKLLARDEPNRAYFKAIFHADGRSSPPYELLTRTFGLVVAPIPQGSAQLRGQVETRKPFLLQGMLAAEILATLAPGSENPLARSWLQSEDCFAGNLLKVASFLSTQASSTNTARQQQQQQNSRNPPQRNHVADDDPLAHGSIVNRAMAVLRILVNKSRTVDSEGNANAKDLPGSVLMKKETLLGAMVQKDIEPNMLRLFCGYAGLEE